MSEVCFYLKEATKKGTTPIYLQFKYRNLRLKYYFGESIHPSNWNFNKQRVKSNKQTATDGQHSLNELLDTLRDIVLSTYRKGLSSGIPPLSALKQALDNFLNQNKEEDQRESLFKLAERFESGEIKNREGEEKSRNTTKTYKTVIGHLINFQKSEKYPVDFGTITLEFYRKYINYLSKLGLAQNTRAKHIQVIKAIMNEAFDLGYTTNSDHRHKKFKAAWEESDAVYLTDKEILQLFNFDLSDNKRLEQCKDLFVFGCFVGLRYSDYSSIKPENIEVETTEDGSKEYYLQVITAKTKERVVVPCNPIVLQIFEKYKSNANRLPRALSNQKFNDYIKEACQKAGLTEKGRLLTQPDLELWECISSHTARRSFASNLYLQGFPPIDLMKITGHRTEKSFLKYIRVSKLETAKRLNLHIKKNWSKATLKAVG